MEAFAIWLVGAWCGGLIGFLARGATMGAKRIDVLDRLAEVEAERELQPGDFAEAVRRVKA